MAQTEAVSVTVIYALPERQTAVHLTVPVGTSVAETVANSGLTRRFPQINEHPLSCAIYGQAVPLTRVVRPGDRVEILRPLVIDPKESRRQAAARSRARSNRA
jgi:uncharacterized protein